jgi:hypothetical protein
MPISEACIAKKGDVRGWSHLRDLPLQELETREVMLVIGLQENSSMFCLWNIDLEKKVIL